MSNAMARETVAHTEVPATPAPAPPITLTFGADAVLISAALTWLLLDQVVKPWVRKRIDQRGGGENEQQRITEALAQIAVLTGATRVTLGVFHNGSIDSSGFHLQRLSTIGVYASTGVVPTGTWIKDMPIAKIMPEMEPLLRETGWIRASRGDVLADRCRDYLERNDIEVMCNRLVRVGNLPIGVLSLKYDWPKEGMPEAPEGYEGLLEDLLTQVSLVLRSRIVEPGPARRVFGKLLGTVQRP
jgi:hypothetical protein